MAKKPYKPYVPVKPFYVPPAPLPSSGGGMRMVMNTGFYGLPEQKQVQVMKLSPRVRLKPLSDEAKNSLLTFKGRKVKND